VVEEKRRERGQRERESEIDGGRGGEERAEKSEK